MVLVVAAVLVDVLDAPDRVLAARRTGPAALAGGWEFPGGKVEPGETPVEALHRELAEELGVAVALGAELKGPVDGCWPIGAGIAMRAWLATVVTGTPAVTGSHDALRWLRRDELTDVAWLPADVALVERVRGLLA